MSKEIEKLINYDMCNVFQKALHDKFYKKIEELKKEIIEIKKSVDIHETFFKKQYQYDKNLIMDRFLVLETKILDALNRLLQR